MENNQSELLLYLIAISGEFSSAQARRIFRSDHYRRKIITALKADGLIKSYYGDGIKGFRLLKAAKDVLLIKDKKLYGYYLSGSSETNRVKSEFSRRQRLHLMSEVYVTMYLSGVEINRNNKPCIFGKGFIVEPEKNEQFFSTPVFYSSREVKELGEETRNLTSSRFIGTFLTDENIYLVYNTGDSVMKWNYKSELRAKSFLDLFLCKNMLVQRYGKKEITGLITGESMETAYRLLTSKGTKNRTIFVLDSGFNNLLYIPNDNNGELLIRILSDSNFSKSLDTVLTKGFLKRNTNLSVEHDAIDKDGNLVLLGYTMNLPRISRFNTMLSLHHLKGVIICFDFQADTLIRFCGTHIRIISIKKEKIERGFL